MSLLSIAHFFIAPGLREKVGAANMFIDPPSGMELEKPSSYYPDPVSLANRASNPDSVLLENLAPNANPVSLATCTSYEDGFSSSIPEGGIYEHI